jgi:hypothetical protein
MGRAIVHVATSRVEVTVGAETYWIETACGTPIVSELRPGRYLVRMQRSGRILHEEEITIEAGEERMLIVGSLSDSDCGPQEDCHESSSTGGEAVCPEGRKKWCGSRLSR